MPLTIISPAFKQGEVIPTQYTQDGENVSPPLQWHGAPPETRSFVVLVEDPDAPSGTFRHWAIYKTSRLVKPACRWERLAKGTAVLARVSTGSGMPATTAPSRPEDMGRTTTVSGSPPSTCRISTSRLRRRPRTSGRRRSLTLSPRRRWSASTSADGADTRS
jgi:hypothetical protein